MALFDQVSNDIKEAMKAKDKVRLETLRNIKKYFIEAKTAPGANDTLEDDAALKILQKLAKQGTESANLYKEKGREDLAEEELAQVRVIEGYLPKQMSPEELEVRIDDSFAISTAGVFIAGASNRMLHLITKFIHPDLLAQGNVVVHPQKQRKFRCLGWY